MTHNFLFWCTGLPSEFIVRSRSLRFITPLLSVRQLFAKFAERRMPEVAKVLLGDKSLLGLHLRNHLRNERDAFEEAYARIARLLDTYSLVCGHTPKLLPIVVRACDGDTKATVATFDFSGTAWAEIDGKNPKDWQKRNDTILELLLPAMDVALKGGRRSDLSEQLLTSLKMFAQGCRSHDRQIHFLCKFTALEGLVCGDERYKKHYLLRTRLKQLLRRRVTLRTIDRLWNFAVFSKSPRTRFVARVRPWY